MRSILIVGAGQSGLVLALWLSARGYEVTVATDRSAADVASGVILSTQVLFGPALDVEHAAGLDFWHTRAPRIDTLEFATVDPDGRPLLAWSGRLAPPAQSVDQRTKFAHWMRLLEERGGRLAIGPLSVHGVEQLCRAGRYDLVIIAAASSAVAALFPADEQQCPPNSSPRRMLSAVYLYGVEPTDGRGQFVRVPGCGEIIAVPALTGDTDCHIVLIEAVPGGPWDTFADVAGDPRTHLARMLELLAGVAPAVHERFRGGVLTDPGGRLVGAVTPMVRHPVTVLPSGRLLVGMADTVCRMDPLGAQGANTAARCALEFGQAIAARGDRPFDRQWMCGVAGACWERFARPALAWTEVLLDPPPPVQTMIAAAERDQATADALTSGFADPAAVLARMGHLRA